MCNASSSARSRHDPRGFPGGKNRIAKAPAEALAWTKCNLNRAARIDLRTALDIEAHLQPFMLLTEGHKAAIQKLLS